MKGNTGARIPFVYLIFSNFTVILLITKSKLIQEIGSNKSTLYPRKCEQLFRRTQ